MEFVNSIGAIVHTEVHLHGGSANKNIGDAFLLVWKFPEECGLQEVEDAKLKKTDRTTQEKIAAVADRALASFLVIISALKRSPRLNEYRQREDLQASVSSTSFSVLDFSLKSARRGDRWKWADEEGEWV